MTFTLFIGFASIAGLLTGYFTARIAPPMALYILWGVALATLVVCYLQSQMPDTSLDGLFVLLVLIPFTGCVLVAGGIGLVVRRIVESRGAR